MIRKEGAFMTDQTLRIRDGVVGAAVVLSVTLGFKVSVGWFWLTGLIGVLMIASAVSGICFLHRFIGHCSLRDKSCH